jgi:hypothetical protein
VSSVTPPKFSGDLHIHKENGMWTAHVSGEAGKEDLVYPLVKDDKPLWRLIKAIQNVSPQSRVFVDDAISEHPFIARDGPDSEVRLLPITGPSTGTMVEAAVDPLRQVVEPKAGCAAVDSEDETVPLRPGSSSESWFFQNKTHLIVAGILGIVVGYLIVSNWKPIGPACEPWTLGILNGRPNSAGSPAVSGWTCDNGSSVIVTYQDGSTFTDIIPSPQP